MIEKVNDVELYERIKALLNEFTPKGASANDISLETRLLEDLNVDSARVVELVLDLEDAFHIRIEDGLIDSLQTVGDLVSLVKAKIA